MNHEITYKARRISYINIKHMVLAELEKAKVAMFQKIKNPEVTVLIYRAVHKSSN